jgi:hypothetical protein
MTSMPNQNHMKQSDLGKSVDPMMQGLFSPCGDGILTLLFLVFTSTFSVLHQAVQLHAFKLQIGI